MKQPKPTRNPVKKPFIIPLFFVLIVSLLFLHVLQNTDNLRSLKFWPRKYAAQQSAAKIKSLKLSTDEYGTVRDELFQKLKKENPRAAIELLKKKMADNPAVLQSCHELLHEVGRESYRKYKDFGMAAQYQDEVCVSGYIHGIIEEYFQQAEDVDVAMLSVCEKYPKGKYITWECYHGIGHGLMYFSDNDLPLSVQKCGLFKDTFAQSACANGAYMENFNADEVVHPSRYLDPKDPFSPCRNSVFRTDCFMNVAIYTLKAQNYHYQKVFDMCRAFTGGDRSSCTLGAGVQMTRRNMDDVDFIDDFCMHQKDDQVEPCYDGVVSWYVGFYGSIKEARHVCNEIDMRYRPMCEKAVESYSGLF